MWVSINIVAVAVVAAPTSVDFVAGKSVEWLVSAAIEAVVEAEFAVGVVAQRIAVVLSRVSEGQHVFGK